MQFFSLWVGEWDNVFSVGKGLPRGRGGNGSLERAYLVLSGPNAQIKRLDFLGPLESMNTLSSPNNKMNSFSPWKY